MSKFIDLLLLSITGAVITVLTLIISWWFDDKMDKNNYIIIIAYMYVITVISVNIIIWVQKIKEYNNMKFNIIALFIGLILGFITGGVIICL